MRAAKQALENEFADLTVDELSQFEALYGDSYGL
jgi:hypothetical protein